jgi:hypothetical protein
VSPLLQDFTAENAENAERRKRLVPRRAVPPVLDFVFSAFSAFSAVK